MSCSHGIASDLGLAFEFLVYASAGLYRVWLATERLLLQGSEYSEYT